MSELEKPRGQMTPLAFPNSEMVTNLFNVFNEDLTLVGFHHLPGDLGSKHRRPVVKHDDGLSESKGGGRSHFSETWAASTNFLIIEIDCFDDCGYTRI